MQLGWVDIAASLGAVESMKKPEAEPGTTEPGFAHTVASPGDRSFATAVIEGCIFVDY